MLRSTRDTGHEFAKAVLTQTCECNNEDVIVLGSEKNRQVIELKKNYKCSVYYRTSELRYGWWGLTKKVIDDLKENSHFVVAFLRSAEDGYILYGKDIDGFLRSFNQNSDNQYLVKEEELPLTRRTTPFLDINKFIILLKDYRKADKGCDI